ncbi:MAG: SPOR domain-containing protein [Bacteroidetes bacterium]|nr:SPOR domain-containing protein [Bacteroidota bacterium]
MADDTNDKEKNQEEDNFGLPDLEYKPLDQLDTTQTEQEASTSQEEQNSNQQAQESSETSVYYEEEEEGGSKSGVAIAIIVLLILGVGGFFIYKYVWVPKQEKAKLALLEKERVAKEKIKADSITRAEAERLRLEEEAKKNAKPTTGAIDTLSQRTGHFYVIIASAVDGDLVMDRAKKLSAAGTSSRIIKPYGKWKFYRLGIGDFDTFANAQASADASKSEYGDALWVLKY